MSSLSKTVARWTGNIVSYGAAHAGCFVLPTVIGGLQMGGSANAVLSIFGSAAMALAADRGIQNYAPTVCRCRRNSFKRQALQIALPAVLISAGMHLLHDPEEHEKHLSKRTFYTNENGEHFQIFNSMYCFTDGHTETFVDTIPYTP